MENIKNNKKKIVIIALAVLLIITAAVIGVLLYERELNNYRNEMIDELIEKQGTYDEKSIVLNNTSFGEAERLAKKLGAKLRITENGKFATLTLEDERSILDIFKDENNIKELKSLTPDYEARINEEENDEETLEKEPSAPVYQVKDALYSNQSYLNYMNLQTIWSKTKGKGMSVAVIDTGIDTDHPDLVGKISEYSYNATLDKIVKDYQGENGGYDWSLIEDQVGHGTQVAGVIGANMDANGITGIAPEVEIVVIKAECAPNGTFVRTSDLVFGIYYAIECDVDVINMSFGTKINLFGDATYLAYDSDIICVASAGNNGSSAENYPAADQYVIGVGALEAEGWELAEYSNYGINTDVVAPGTVYTTKMGGGYGTIEGTSFSSPLVAGAISLYLSQNKYQSYDKVYELLSVSSMDLGDLGKDWYFGYGALDVSALILEERGTITFEMLTDELDDIEATFIRNHTMQELPIPERLYSLFDGWYYDDKCTEEYAYYEDVFTSDLTLYAKWINESDGIPYTYEILDDGTVEITSYTGHRRYITIPEKIEGRVVSSIGAGAFLRQSNIREINLPSQLKTIKNSAFEGCSSLLNIQIPDTVTSIGERAFYDCFKILSIELSTSSQLLTIGQYAFASCGRIESFDLPSTVTYVDATAFLGNLMQTQINVMNGNESFVSKDGVLFNRYATTLIAYPMGKSGDYIIPNSVTRISEYAFAFSLLEFVDLARVETIGSYAFKGSLIESLVIKDTVTSLGTGAFSMCPALSEVYIGKGINSISSGAFSGCTYLRQITIPNNITSIDYAAFGQSGLTEISFDSGSDLRMIGMEAFAMTNLVKIEIPSSVNLIDTKAFYKCYSLEEVVFDSNSTLNSINDYAFSKTGLKAIDFPLSLEYIDSFAFSESALEGEIYIHENIEEIGAGVFSYCNLLEAVRVSENNNSYCDINGVLYTKDLSQLFAYPCGSKTTSYVINESTNNIIPYAFAGAEKLYSVKIPQQLRVIGEFAFYACGARSYLLNTVLEEISASSFAKNENLQSITIPKSVKTISRGAFSYNTNMRSITFENEGSLVRIGNEAFYKSGITEIKIPSTVSTIGQGAFNGCEKLYKVTFEENSQLNAISAYMFEGALSLCEIIFEKGSQLKSLQAHALDGMSKIQRVDLSNTQLTNVDNFAFRFCESLTDLSLPSTVTYIGRYAFYGCSSLSSLSLPSCLEYLGSYAFLGTDGMVLYFMSENFPPYLQEEWDRGVTSYHLGVISVEEKDGWKYATLVDGGISIISYTGENKEIDMEKLNLGGDIVSIGGQAFEFSKVETVKLPSTLTSIQKYAFASSKLKEITIPKSVTFIGQNAFLETPIKALTFETGSALRVIEQYAFAYTESLNSVSLPSSIVTLGTGVFLNSGIKSLTFDKEIGIEKIPPLAFANTKIEALTLPNSVSVVDDNAFRETKALKTVNFGNNEYIQLMSNAFYLSGLSELTIPKNVGYIGEFCFVGLTNLKEFKVDSDHEYYKAIDGLLYEKDGRKLICVPSARQGTLTLPREVEEIGFGAFEYSSLERVEFNKDSNILTLGYRAFFGMENLKEITIPKTVVSIDYYAFAYCTSLEKVFFEEGSRLSGIYEGAFCGDERLYDITLPNEVLEISDYVFFGCSSIKKLPISSDSKIKGIYSYAFAYTGLAELNLPITVNEIGSYAFRGSSVERVYIPDDNYEVLTIGYGAFDSCNNMVELTTPIIGTSLYYPESTSLSYIFGTGNDSLKVMNISDVVTVIPDLGITGFTALETLNIPASVTTLGYGAISTPAKYELLSPVYVNSYTFGGGNVVGNVVLTGNKLQMVSFNGPYVVSVTLPDTVDDRISFRNCTSLESVNIPLGITAIDENCFENCTALKKIELHSGITSLGEKAFYKCTGLEEVTGLSGITQMGNEAFSGCSSLKRIESLGSIKVVPAYAFAYCESLETAPLPSTLTQIGSYAFMQCYSLNEINIPNGVTSIGIDAFVNCSGLTRIHIPGSVSVIDEYVFRGCKGLISVTIGEGVTDINRFAFSNCYVLREITLPSTLESILDYAFGSTDVDVIRNNSSLNLTIGGKDYGEIAKKTHTIYDKDGNATYKDPSSPYTYYTTSDGFKFIVNNDEYRLIEYVGNSETATLPENANGQSYILDGVYGIKNVIIPSSFKEINAKAFYKNALLESVELKEGVTKIDDEAFYQCSGLKSINMPSSLTSIGQYAFRECAITTIDISNVTSLGGGVFIECKQLEMVKLGKIEKLSSTFSGCSSLKEITIPSTVTQMSSRIFVNCTSLESIIIPEGVTVLGDFTGCTSLKSIKLPSTLKQCGSFAQCSSLVSVTIPEGVQSVPDFTDCKSLRYVYLGKSATGISSSAFKNCDSLKEIEISPENTSFSSKDGIIYGKQNINERIVVFSVPTLNGVITIEDGTNIINASAFANNKAITRVIIPKSVNEIGENAFSDCTSLESVVFEGGRIRDRAFSGCTSLKDISLEGATKIGESAFEDCTSLKNVKFGQGLTSIGSYAFEKTSIERVDIPSSVTELKAGAFMSCDSLVEASLPSGITIIPYNCFAYCYHLRRVEIPNTITIIGENAFTGDANLVKVDIPSSVTTIEKGAFYRTSLTELTLPSTLTTIEADAFGNCSTLYLINNNSSISLTVGSSENGRVAENAKAIRNKNGVYQYASGISDYSYIDTENGVRFALSGSQYTLVGYIGDNTENAIELPSTINNQVYELSSLAGFTRVKLPSTITEIKANAFQQNGTLIEVVIPSSVKKINYGAFAYCPRLEEVYICSGVEEIGAYAFKNCIRLKKVTLENGVISLEPECFADNPRLEEINIPNSTKTIGSYSFSGCTSLSKVTLGDNIELIEATAFRDTAFLENKENWTGDVLIVNNYLLAFAEGCEYCPYYEGLKCVFANGSVSVGSQIIVFNENAKLSTTTKADTIIFVNMPKTKVLHEFFGSNKIIPSSVKNVVILDAGVPLVNPNFFEKASGLNIYLSKTEKDLRWDANYPGWNNGNQAYYEDEWVCVQFYNGKTLIKRSYLLNSELIVRPYIYDTYDETSIYGLIGWDLDGDGIKDRVPVTSATDLKAQAILGQKERVYTVSFVDKNGEKVAIYTLPYGEKINAPQMPTVKGYDFVMWDGYYDGITVNGDMTFTALMMHKGNGHEYTDGVYTSPTCTKGGGYLYTCTICDEAYFNQTESYKGHILTNTTVPPTCTLKGYTIYHCENCDDINIYHSFVPRAEHSYGEWSIVNNASCTENGSKIRYCVDCQSGDVEIIRKSGHEYSVDIIEKSTCIKEGLANYTCKTCNNVSQGKLDLVSHSYELKTSSYDFIKDLVELMPNIFVGKNGDSAFYYECITCGDISTQDKGGVQTNSAGISGACTHVAGNWQVVKYAQGMQNGIFGKYCVFCSELIEAKVYSYVQITEKGSDYIKYEVVQGYEYSIDGVNYNDSGIFNGLGSDNEYVIYVRDKVTKEDKGPTLVTAAKKYTYTFYDYNGNILKQESVFEGEKIVLPSFTPSREKDVQYTYTFSHYDGYSEGMVVTGDASFTAIYNKVLNKYTYIFYHDDGVTELKRVSADYGTVITMPTINPTKENNGEISYAFSHYEGFREGMILTGDISFKAVFNEGKIKYTYSFIDINGNVISSGTLEYGSVVVAPSIPTNPQYPQGQYNGVWKGYYEGYIITGNVEFKLEYVDTSKKYSCAFADWNGRILYSYIGTAGSVIVLPSTEPSRNNTLTHTYTFIGYEGYYEGMVLTENRIFTAMYEEKPIVYTYTFLDWDGSIIASGELMYGEIIPKPKDPARPSEGEILYTFTGFTGYFNNMTIHSNVTFTATYKETKGGLYNVHTNEIYSAPGQIVIVDLYAKQLSGNGGVIELFVNSEYASVVQIYLYGANISTQNTKDYVKIELLDLLSQDTKIVGVALMISNNAPLGNLEIFDAGTNITSDFKPIELCLLGDVDQNGVIDNADIDLLNRYALGEFELSEKEQYFADVFKTDVYEPGSHINAKDVLRLRQLIKAQANAMSCENNVSNSTIITPLDTQEPMPEPVAFIEKADTCVAILPKSYHEDRYFVIISRKGELIYA